jgi:outer membrane lipoprotein SlyB
MDAKITRSSAHPLVIVAAVAITLFSMVGIGAVLGWIPTSTGNQAAAVPPLAQAPEAAAVPPVPATPEPPQAAPGKPRAKHVAKAVPPAPPVQMAEMVPPPPPPNAAPPRAICGDCGVIESVREIKKEGQGSGAGAVGGAVLGGVLGHQTGNGTGRGVMTVLGALGGALAGNEVEKKATTSSEYRIVVRFDDGSSRTYPSATAPAWRIGDRVRVVNGTIRANS